MFLSSSIAVFVILMSLFIIGKKHSQLYLGVILATSFLINPIYAFFCLAFVLFYLAIISIKDRIQWKEVFKNIGILFIIPVSIFLLHLLLLTLAYETPPITLFLNYINYLKLKLTPKPSLNIDIISVIKQESATLLFGDYRMVVYFAFFAIFPILGLILIKTEKQWNTDKFQIYIRLGMILLIIFSNVLPIFLSNSFYDIFHERSLECFLPFLVICTGCSLNWMNQKLIGFWRQLRKKYSIFQNLLDKRGMFLKKFLHVRTFFLIIIILGSFAIYLYARDNFIYKYHYDDSIIDCVFYLKNNVNFGENITGQSYNHRYNPYNLLINYNIINYDLNNNWTFPLFVGFVENNSIGYVIIKLSNFGNNFTTEFRNSALFSKIFGDPDTDKFQLFKVI